MHVFRALTTLSFALAAASAAFSANRVESDARFQAPSGAESGWPPVVFDDPYSSVDDGRFRMDMTATPAAMGMFAQESTTPDETPLSDSNAADDGWWFRPSLAIWLPGINGTIGVRGRKTSVNASFTDILDDTDSLVGIMGTFEFGKGRLGGYVNGAYMKLGATAGPNDGIDTTTSVALLGFGVSYDIGRWQMEYTATASQPARDLVLQLRAGGRYTAVDLDATFPVIGNRSGDESWVDPMLGARLNIPLCQSFSCVLSGEIGGFGAASELAWGAGALFSWDFHLGHLPSSLQFGYLAVGDDYSNGSGNQEIVWDTILHGPVINWSIRF